MGVPGRERQLALHARQQGTAVLKPAAADHAGQYRDILESELKMDNETIKAIEAIIKRGNDAEIRRKGDGYIVLEVKKTIKYSTSA